MLINNSNFRLTEIPNYHPELEYYDRLTFWKGEKRKCIEGYWSSGKWMSGPLYYYVNFHNIQFEDDSSVAQAFGLPFLRDIDWELFQIYEECRGFSGFTNDTIYTCDRKYGPELELSVLLGRITRKQAESMTYIPAREYLRKNHGKDLGKPLYKNSSKHLMSVQSRGGGKATPWFTKIYTPEGYKMMRDINVGDKIIGSNGKPITVLQKHPQGVQDVWEVEFQDDRKSYCHEEHLWEVSNRSNKKNSILSTKEIYEKGVIKDLGYRKLYNYYIQQSPITQHTRKDLTIHPYLLGALLGDGTMTTGTPKIANDDLEVINKFKELLPDYELKHDVSTTNNYTIVYRGIRGRINNRFGAPSIPDKTNPLRKEIVNLNLSVKSYNKFIPNQYKYASVEQRLELVKGLMDTDGSILEGGQCEFTNGSEQLVKDLAEILRSLGISCKIGKPDDRSGEVHEIHGHLVRRNLVMYRLHFNPGSYIVFNIERKKARLKNNSQFNKRVAIKNIKKLNSKQEQFCVTVDAEDSLYLTEDYIVTHNSYATSGIADHNFLFDGATDYDDYLQRKQSRNYTASDTIIGAIDTKFSEPLMKKLKTGLELLPGSYNLNGDIYPSPLAITWTGSMHPNKDATSLTGSVLRHRTFKDNPFAANGTRANLCALDEVGFMYNIKEAWGAIEALQASKEKKNLVIWALGTGGLVSGKAALYAESLFRNPQDYNCVEFEDIFEHRGKIGYFVPYSKTLNEFKTKPNYITDEELSKLYIENKRKEAKKSSDPSVYQTEIINGPMLPSEAFLILEGSFFPILQLKEQLAEVEGGIYAKYMEASFKGHLSFVRDSTELEFITQQDVSPVRKFPLSRNDEKKGCIEIWMKPQKNEQGVVPRGTYIAGIDVVDKDKSTTDSLPSIVVMNRYTRQIVAEYTGRTNEAKDFYEIVRKMLLYYNAIGMYEKNLIGLYNHFDHHKCTYLLADTPYQLRSTDTYQKSGNTSKGINATGTINSEARNFIKSWLQEKISETGETKVYQTIYSPAMLTELIMWNPDGNFDRVSSLGMLMWLDATMYKEQVKHINEVKGFLDNDYWKEMGLIKKPVEIIDTSKFYQ